MKKSVLVALALAALAAPCAYAVTGSVAVTSVATDAVCDGFSNVTITVNTQAPPPESAPLDLIIAIDDSGSLSNTDFNLQKNAAITFVNALDFTGGVRRVGVLKFATNAQTIVNLTNNRTVVLNAINSIVHAGGNTNITAAIRLARQMIQSHGQPASDKVLLLMTDGQNNQEVSGLVPETNLFKALPGEIFALGFGSVSVPQLQSIASDPDSTHVFITPNSSQLSTIAAQIAETIQNPAATDVVLDALTAAPFSPVDGSAAVDAGSVAAVPGGFRWTIPTLGTETRTLSFQVLHSGNVDGLFDALSSLAGTFDDSEGDPQTISADSPTIMVSGCNDAPVADAGPDQSVDLSGSTTAPVTLDASGSTDADPQDTLEYSWSEGGSEIATGVSPTVSLGLGTHVITLTVSDGRLSDSDEVVITVSDPTPPSVTANVSGTLGLNGWYTSDIHVSWTVTDDESDASTTGCEAVSVTADTAGVSFTCSATSAGGTTAETVTVKRDATAPVVGYAGNQPSYEVTETVNITCSASDALSGLASSTCAPVSGPATDFVGVNTYSATATDNAGNTATAEITFTVTPTAASICALAELYIGHSGVAHSLCTTIQQESVGAFINQVNAHRGKRLTHAQADTLIRLARML